MSKLNFLCYSACKSNFALVERVVFLRVNRKLFIAVSGALSVAPTDISVCGSFWRPWRFSFEVIREVLTHTECSSILIVSLNVSRSFSESIVLMISMLT